MARRREIYGSPTEISPLAVIGLIFTTALLAWVGQRAEEKNARFEKECPGRFSMAAYQTDSFPIGTQSITIVHKGLNLVGGANLSVSVVDDGEVVFANENITVPAHESRTVQGLDFMRERN